MKLKVCGMKYNPLEVAALLPDYLGFIFWEPSKRFFDKEIPSLPLETKKIGVFVDDDVEEVLRKIEKYNLWGVQLHGNEGPDYCDELSVRPSLPRRQAGAVETSNLSTYPVLSASTSLSTGFVERPGETKVKIIKVFSIKDDFDFEQLKAYEDVCDYYLFDTKGKLPGGNGYAFNWAVLKDYPSTKPYFLSGGIGLDETDSIKEFLKKPESKYCHAIDVNSRFEVEPGLKNIEKLKEFINHISA